MTERTSCGLNWRPCFWDISAVIEATLHIWCPLHKNLRMLSWMILLVVISLSKSSEIYAKVFTPLVSFFASLSTMCRFTRKWHATSWMEYLLPFSSSMICYNSPKERSFFLRFYSRLWPSLPSNPACNCWGFAILICSLEFLLSFGKGCKKSWLWAMTFGLFARKQTFAASANFRRNLVAFWPYENNKDCDKEYSSGFNTPFWRNYAIGSKGSTSGKLVTTPESTRLSASFS